MFTAAELAEHRRDAEQLMVDEYDAYEPDGTDVVDGMKRPKFAFRGHTIGKIQSPEPATVNTGGVERQVMRARLDTPVASVAPVVGWEYQCTYAAPTSDPSGLGRRWRVVPARTPSKTWMTARRVEVEEVPR